MANLDQQDAAEIYNDLLDRVTACYVNKDFDAFSELIHLPHHITTPSDRFVIRSVDELRTVFDINCAKMVLSCGQTLQRELLYAHFKGQDRIDGSHRTQMPSGVETKKRPYPSKSVLMWIGMRWQICASDYHVDADSHVNKVFREALQN